MSEELPPKSVGSESPQDPQDGGAKNGSDHGVTSPFSDNTDIHPDPKHVTAAISLRELITATRPRTSREDTVSALSALFDSQRPSPSDVHGEGICLVSDVPDKAKWTRGKSEAPGVIMGIDEAGRGPVLGPMTYGAAYWSTEDSDCIPKGFNDSKQLTDVVRTKLFEQIKQTAQVGFVLRVLHASEISRNMLRPDPYNLNAMSHDSAMLMIRSVLDAGVKIETCYVDTVGAPGAYQSKLERAFEGQGIQFVVEKKADAKYAPCSAASVVAKVARDALTARWGWSEPGFEPEKGRDWGSGYPSDPKCKSWLEGNLADPVFGYPDFVRFSWGPAKKALKDGAVEVEWEADEEEGEEGESSGQQMSLNAFVIGTKKEEGRSTKEKMKCVDFCARKCPRLGYFERINLRAVETITQA